MLDRGQHDAIAAAFYTAAAGELEWSAALQGLADAFGTGAAVLALLDPGSSRFRAYSHGRPSDFANDYYASSTFLEDPRTPHFLTIRPGRLYYDHCLYDVEEMSRDPRVQRTVETIDVKYQLGVQLRLPLGVSGALALLSTEAEGHAGEAAIESFRQLAPHIEQSCALGELLVRSAATQAALIEALAARADGVLLLNSLGVLVFANDAAAAILAAGDGLGWSGEAPTTRRGPETRRLLAMIGDVLGMRSAAERRPGGQMLVTRRSGRLPYVVRVLPAPPVERFLVHHSIACVIHIHDLAAVRLPSRRLLQATFGLTERETDLAIELVRHAGLAAAAAAAAMAHNTARNHLRAIFSKCSVTSQVEAVQLFSRLA